MTEVGDRGRGWEERRKEKMQPGCKTNKQIKITEKTDQRNAVRWPRNYPALTAGTQRNPTRPACILQDNLSKEK